jgi:two-component system cell cycle response regulator
MTSSVETDQLRAENRRLHSQLQELITHARTNQSMLARHQAFDLCLISANDFRALIETILNGMQTAFDLPTISLALADNNGHIRRLLDDLTFDTDAFTHLVFLDNDTLGHNQQWEQRLPNTPVLGPYQADQHQQFFLAEQPVSVAIIPLKRHQHIIGYLGMGSHASDRFTPDMATDFIERLASVVAICLENVLNNERLKHIGLTDDLTGIHNRRYIDQRMHEEIARVQREQIPLSCLYIDIDHFKQVNDQFGHQSGDIVLRSISACIKKELRISDALGRFGGEEFMVILSNTTMEDALLTAERIRLSIAGQRVMLIKKKTDIAVSASIGVATLSPAQSHGETKELIQQLITHADQALYRAKSIGRNSVVPFDEHMQNPFKQMHAR